MHLRCVICNPLPVAADSDATLDQNTKMKITFTLESLRESITKKIQTGIYISDVDGYEIKWTSRERNPDGGHRVCDHQHGEKFWVCEIDGSLPVHNGNISLIPGTTYNVVFDEHGYPSHLGK